MSLPKKKTAREEGLEAAWHLFLEQGEKPSTAKVRQIVQRGSDSHLNEGVNAFWDELKAKAQQWHAFPKDADFLMPLVSKLLDDVLHKAQSAYEDQLRDTKQLEVDAKRWIETVDKEKAALEEQLAGCATPTANATPAERILTGKLRCPAALDATITTRIGNSEFRKQPA